ncbi:hypothetical protein TFLX_02067 [Thermoflexales bacterium]|nr:hypothetical protein TFLX_02067 [Thermoflexales bacterium]
MSNPAKSSVAVPYTMTKDNKLVMSPLNWPTQCVCCGDHSPTTVSLQHTARFSSQTTVTSYSRTTTQSGYYLGWQIPCCDACRRHWRKAEPQVSIPSILLLIGFLLMLGVGYALFEAGLSESPLAIGGYVVFLGPLALAGYGIHRWFIQACLRAATRLLTPSCTGTGLGVKVSSNINHVIFVFTSESYARDFAGLNHLLGG